MKRFFWMGSLLSLIVFSGSSAAVDCRLGEKYYFQAKSATDPVRSIEWLHRSIEVCPNFNAWYMLGLFYKNHDKINEAIDAFVQARANAGSSKAEALALARKGELLAQTGQLFQALRALKLAKIFHPEPAPDWLEESLKNARIQCHPCGYTGWGNCLIPGGRHSNQQGQKICHPARGKHSRTV